MAVRFQLRRDTANNWASVNPVLALGEPGVETDTLKVKVGDGTLNWNNLGYTITTQFADLNGKPTTIAGYGITDALALANFSVGAEGTASGDGAIAYDNTTGVFTYTPPDTSTFLTSVPAQTFASLTGKPTSIAGYGITDAITTSNIGSQSVTNSAQLNGLSKIQLWNNSGQGHSTYQTFGAIPNFGVWFMQASGAADTPQAGSQYYVQTQGLGNDYAYGDYALMTAVARDHARKYTYYRTREGGSWGNLPPPPSAQGLSLDFGRFY